MKPSNLEIRRLTIGSDDVVVAGAASKTLTVWSLRTQQLVRQFDSILEPGNGGIAVSEPEGICVVAGWKRGVAGYCLNTGVEKWRRCDLKRMRKVSLTEDGTMVYCGSSHGECFLVSIENGATVKEISGVSRVWVESTGKAMEVEGGVDFAVNSGQQLSVKNETFSVLDVAIGEKFLGISDATGGVRIYDTGSAKLEWKFTPPAESHVLLLAATCPSGFSAVQWNYERGGDCIVFRLAVANKSAVEIGRFTRSADFVFYDSGRKILASSGMTFCCESGKLTRTFEWW